mgnify:CR=1 FL=1
MSDNKGSVTMSDRLTPKYEEESNNIVLGGSIESNDDRLIDTNLDDETLKTLFKGNELAFRLITKWSQDPIEKGFEVKTSEDVDLNEAVEEYRQKLEFDSKMMELNKFVNVFGSAGLGYDLVDSASSPQEEATPQDVEDITGINIIRQEQVDDYEVDDNGEIEYYDLDTRYDLDRIHESRIYHARYYHIEGHPEGFGLLHPLFTSLKVFENVKFGMGQAFYVGGTGFPVMKVQNLDGMSDKDANELQSNFMKDVLKNPGMIIDDEKASVEFRGSQGKALDPDSYVSSLLDIIGTVVGSKQVLTGAIPGGVEGSETNKEEYFGDVSSFQQNKQTPIVRDFVQRLIDYGLVPEVESFRIEWNDLFQKSEEAKAEIKESKSKAFMNLTASGVPGEIAAEEVGLSEETVEALESDGESNENTPGENGGENGQESQSQTDNSYYDRSLTKDTLEKVRDLPGYDRETYFQEGEDREIRKPTNWREPVYSNYKDLREKHRDLLDEFLDRVIDGIDKATVSEDQGFIDKIKGNDDEKVNRFLLERRVDVETEKLENDMKDATRESLKGAFVLGAEKGADDFGEGLSRVFDKHRRELLDETFDKYVTEAYADQTDAVNTAINDRIEEHFKDQSSGINDLKRGIRSLHSGDNSQMYRFDRIARTETARIRNMGYIDETSRRGRNLYDWVGPTDQRTTEICLSIKGDNPYTKKQILDVTSGGLPHINCRHTAVVNSDSILRDQKEVDYEKLQEQYMNIEFDVSMERLDEAHTKFRAAVNKSKSSMERWRNSDCSKKASLSREPIERVLRLKSKNKANWDEDDIQDALRVWNFVNRMLGQKPENPREGPDGCDSKWAISLKNWGHNPFSKDGGTVSLN